MSKAQYTLLAAVIGFYTLLFTYLIARALVGMLRAWRPAKPKLERAASRSNVTARNRAWTRAVWRAPLAPEMERRKQSATMIA
jgi:hypothetical protein